MTGLMKTAARGVAAGVLAFGLGMTTSAQAAVCPTDDDNYLGAGTFTLNEKPEDDDSPLCYAFGNGNLSGNSANDPIITGIDSGPAANPNTIIFSVGVSHIPNLVLLSKTDGSNPYLTVVFPTPDPGEETDTTQGTITIGSLPAGFHSFVLAFVAGNIDPRWAAFYDVGPNMTYDFSIAPSQGGGLSHASLYGVVPIPAALPLMLTAVAGLGLVARRRMKANA